jgi:hypothetical protein
MPRYPYFPNDLDEAIAPFHRWQEQADMLARIYRPSMEPYTALQQQIAALTTSPAADLIQQQHRMLDALHDHSSSFTAKILGEMTRVDHALNQSLRAIMRPPVMEETLGLLEKLGVKRQPMSDALTSALASLRPSREIEAILGAVRQPVIEREVEKMLDLIRVARLVTFDAATQTLTVGGATFAIHDFDEAFEDAAAAADDAFDTERLKVFLQFVLAHSARLKGNKAVAFTLIVLLWLGRTVLEGQIQTIAGELLRPVTDAVIRKLKPAVRDQVVAVRDETPLVDVRSLRLVTATNLQVRVAPRRDNSHIVSRVSTPQVVMVIRPGKDWTLVQYRNGDAMIRGWVFSRYLTKIDG